MSWLTPKVAYASSKRLPASMWQMRLTGLVLQSCESLRRGDRNGSDYENTGAGSLGTAVRRIGRNVETRAWSAFLQCPTGGTPCLSADHRLGARCGSLVVARTGTCSRPLVPSLARLDRRQSRAGSQPGAASRNGPSMACLGTRPGISVSAWQSMKVCSRCWHRQAIESPAHPTRSTTALPGPPGRRTNGGGLTRTDSTSGRSVFRAMRLWPLSCKRSPLLATSLVRRSVWRSVGRRSRSMH